jgi:hypothetical protein
MRVALSLFVFAAVCLLFGCGGSNSSSSNASSITSPGAERWNNLGAYTSQGISLPPPSEVTVVLTK